MGHEYGYMGKILWVDLTAGRVETRRLDEAIYRDFLGGIGLGVRVLFDAIPPDADPLGPENVLGFVPGLLTGSGLPFTGRWMAVGKSPLTGGWGDANSGGFFGPELRKAGYDGLFFSGVAPEPVVLWIDSKGAELRPAGALWGLDCEETQASIRRTSGEGNARVACIGPAGERQSRIAAIMNDEGRAAARSGLGAVMGSKRLKAVAVRGREKLPLADPKRVKTLRQELVKVYRRPASWMDRFVAGHSGLIGRLMRRLPISLPTPQSLVRQVYRAYGTSGTTDYSSLIGDSPIKNWAGVGYRDFPYDSHSSKLSGDEVVALQRKRYHCATCPLGCGGIIDVPAGPYQGPGTKPEYETLAAFGSLCLNNDLQAILTLNEMCNREGIDTISLGGVIAFVIECAENGVLTTAELDGLTPTWGDSEVIIALAERIVRREGIGDLLADGVKLAADRIGRGAAAYAVHAGGQELPMHDPRLEKGFATAYQAEPTPGRHTIAGELYVGPMDLPGRYPAQFKNAPAGRGQAISSQFIRALSAAGLCMFGTQTSQIPLAEWISAATGWPMDDDELLVIGDRIASLQQVFNIRAGIEPTEVSLHPRALGEPPLDAGPTAGVTIDLVAQRTAFYRQMGWEPDGGHPTRERLAMLGLADLLIPADAAIDPGAGL